MIKIRNTAISLLYVSFQFNIHTVESLVINQLACSSTFHSLVCSLSNNDYDDFSSLSDGDEDRTGGQELANEFFKQLRKRENEKKPISQKKERDNKLVFPNDNASFSIEGTDENMAKKKEKSPVKKFTGQRLDDDASTASAGLFSGRGASVYSVPSASQSKRQMIENETRLVERSRNVIKFQAAVTIGFLLFAIYIGLTGGITSNVWNSVPDGLDTNIEGLDGVLPIPNESRSSIWL